MKLKLGSSLIFGFGGLLALGLSYWQHSSWYMLSLVPFVIWALLYAHEEVNKGSWHYRVTHKYFEDELKTVCKACPYWGLTTLATVVFVIEYGVKIIYGTILQLLARVWQTVAWLFGYDPCWRNSAYRMAHGKNYMFYNHSRDSDKFGRVHSPFWPVFVIGPIVAAVVIFRLSTDHIYSFYRSTPWYYSLLVSYGVMVAAVEIAEIWRAYVWQPLFWPGIRRSVSWIYRKGCPDVKFVEKVRVPADPQLPPATSNPN